MKKTTLFVILCWLVISAITSQAQLAGSCSTCFDSQITKATKVDDHCTDYELKVFYTGKCAHALSHFTVAIPACATLSNLNHHSSCTSQVGYDPTTGLTGFKIAAPNNFGKSSTQDITVTFRLCSNGSCDQVACLSTRIAYKAGNCFELDTVKAPCTTTQLKAHLQKKNISCNGLSDGQLTAIVDQGTAPYHFSWSNGSTQSSVQNLAVGVYSVVVKDTTGAQVTLTDSIQQPGAIKITPSITSASCSGQSNGAIKVTASGGNGGYTFLWSNGSTADSLTNLPTGNYSVTVKDSVGCSATSTFFIDVQKKLILNASNQLPSCGQSNGSLSVSASGGTSPYHYVWSTGDTTTTISKLPQGTYSVTVTDAQGCSTQSTYFLRENNTLALSASITPTTCLDNNSGAIDLTVNGGTAPYSYVWSNGSTSQDISGLAAGIYTVTVTDALGCQRTTKISVFKKSFDVSANVIQPLCSGNSTGSISLTSSGGVAPYTYVWSTGETTSSIQNLAPGTYKVTVTDNTGCSKLLTYFITDPAPISASSIVQNISCTSFSIDLTVSGGTAPYQYNWSNGAQTQDVTGVTAGSYSVAITDANGCSSTKQIQVDSTATWSCLINPLVSAVTCSSSGNKIFTSVAGATSYSWTIASSDSSWVVESGASSDTLQFKAGNSNTTATFTLTIVKDGCTQTCSYTASACTSGTGTGGSGGGNNESCGDCFKSTIVKNSDNGSCATYTVDITTDGNCRYDLSHFVIAIPCGEISNYSDSGHWPLVLGKDPTTGLTGLKVDNVSNFGKAVGAFTLQFSVCYSSDCEQTLKNWNPVVAYKAGQCVSYDTLSMGSGSGSTCHVYPNPCKDHFTIEVQCDSPDNGAVEVYDQCGRRVCEPVSVSLESGKNQIPMDASHLPQNIYFYRVKTSRATHHGRILKSN